MKIEEEKQCINSNIGLINMQLLYTYTCKDKHRRGVLRERAVGGALQKFFATPFFAPPFHTFQRIMGTIHMLFYHDFFIMTLAYIRHNTTLMYNTNIHMYIAQNTHFNV